MLLHQLLAISMGARCPALASAPAPQRCSQQGDCGQASDNAPWAQTRSGMAATDRFQCLSHAVDCAAVVQAWQQQKLQLMTGFAGMSQPGKYSQQQTGLLCSAHAIADTHTGCCSSSTLLQKSAEAHSPAMAPPELPLPGSGAGTGTTGAGEGGGDGGAGGGGGGAQLSAAA